MAKANALLPHVSPQMWRYEEFGWTLLIYTSAQINLLQVDHIIYGHALAFQFFKGFIPLWENIINRHLKVTLNDVTM